MIGLNKVLCFILFILVFKNEYKLLIIKLEEFLIFI